MALGYQAKHEWLVCIDSDGCVYDTMDIKHKECFCPAAIKVWGLQPVSKYAREAWEFGNLYSVHRGRSRFHELLLMFDWLAEREEVKTREFQLPDISSFRHWVETAPALNNSELAKHPEDPVLARTLEWSLECNRRIEELVFGVPPFPGVRTCLEQLSQHADIAIVSATAREALKREWEEHDMMRYVHRLYGQEDGSKKECIAGMRAFYPKGNILMIGDAPGDLEAARANGVMFYPICPGEEIESWHIFGEEAMECFLSGRYNSVYEAQQLKRFRHCLAEVPPWGTADKNVRS